MLVEDILKAMDLHHQVDLIFTSKAFDTVPYKCLLTKLHYYCIYGPLHDWIKVCTRKYQRVIIDGESSRKIEVF